MGKGQRFIFVTLFHTICEMCDEEVPSGSPKSAVLREKPENLNKDLNYVGGGRRLVAYGLEDGVGG